MDQKLFETLNLSQEVLRAVAEMNYVEMTPIQFSAIPLILEGQDVIGRSSTGTGKTAAFGLPAVERISRTLRNRPQALVLAPTRELAMQTGGELRKYSKYKKNVRVAVICGGEAMGPQLAALRESNLVVGTPGRVMDHMRRGTLELDGVELVVLDEADEMLNMGFIDDIREILSKAPEERQTLLFSATMPPAILSLTRQFQREPKIVAVDGGQRTLETIEQFFYHVPGDQKPQALNLLLQRCGGERALVFCNTRRQVDETVEYLSGCGFSATGLHGEMTQGVRSKVMAEFKAGRLHTLVATDVAARGIDVEDVRAVINYDLPDDNECYIHRIGRTGRAGRSGASHALCCTPRDIRRVKDLERFVRTPIRRAYLPGKEELFALRRSLVKERVMAGMSTMASLNWSPLVEEMEREELDLKAALCAMMQMLAGESALEIPEVRDIQPAVRPQTPPGRSAAPARAKRTLGSDRVALRASVGRSQRMEPGFFVSAIVNEAQVPAASIGRIDLHSDHTRIEVTPEAARSILQRMQLTHIHGCRVRFSLDTPAPRRPRRPAKP